MKCTSRFIPIVLIWFLILGGGNTAKAAVKSPTRSLSANPTSLSFGNVLLGTTSTKTVTITNTGNSSMSILQLSISGAGFSIPNLALATVLIPRQSISLRVSFLPYNSGAVAGRLSIMSNATNTVTVALSGTGYSYAGVMSASPSTLNLGSVPVGSSGSQAVTLTNTGNTTVTLSGVSSSLVAFHASGLSFPTYLNAGQSVNVTINFTPTTTGTLTGTLTVASNASNAPTTISVRGTGAQTAQAPTITTQPAGQTITTGQTATFSVIATGTAPLNYLWEKNGAAISGATSASYTTPPETTADNGALFTVAVSNSAGSVSSNAATLTVNPSPVLSLSSNPTSLSFGNVNVGSNSSLSTTVSNNGNANVTISGVNVSGAGYSASGISSGQVVSPGQTATLRVTFAPASAGSSSGSVTITSNASNSPTTVSLTGSGVAPPPAGSPTCGKSGDATNHIPADWTTFVPPAKGQSYVDPTFGCTVTRITDASSQDWSGSFYLPLNMGYATVSPFNANDTYLMLSDGWRRFFVSDLAGNVVVPMSNMPAMNNTWVLWDASSPSVFYYTYQNYLMKGTISGSSVSAAIVHQFSEYAAIDFMDEADVSRDGAHVVIVGGDTSGSSPEHVFVYDFTSNVKGAVYTTSCTGSVNAPNNNCLHKLVQTSDNNVIIQFANDGSGLEQGNRLWTGALPLPQLQDATDHLDAGYDKNDNAVYVELGNSYVLPGLTNPCPSGWGLDVRMVYNPLSAVCLLDGQPAWHVGYRGNAQQPWVGLSFFDSGRTPGPEWFDKTANYAAPTASTWLLYEDEIMVVRIDANNNSSLVYRLARAYSRSNEDFYAQPHGAISRDGKYIAFNSNMAYAHTGCPANFQSATGCTDVYVIKIQ